MCVNKLLVQALESCPSSDATPPAVLPTSVPSRENSKSAGIANANMDSQKLDAIPYEPCRTSVRAGLICVADTCQVSCIYAGHMNPALNESPALQCFEHGNTSEIRMSRF